MKLIIFSDIHGNSCTLKKFAGEIKTVKYDYAVFCGDIFGYYYDQAECIGILREIDRLLWLRGNHDEYFMNIYSGSESEDEYIKKYGSSYKNINTKYGPDVYKMICKMPTMLTLDAKGVKIGIFHGTPDNAAEGRLYPDSVIEAEAYYTEYDIVILGHTHCRMIRYCGNTLIINSGSLGQPRDGEQFGYAVLDTETREVLFRDIEDGCEELYRRIEENDPGLHKLKEVLDRRKSVEKNTCNGN